MRVAIALCFAMSALCLWCAVAYAGGSGDPTAVETTDYVAKAVGVIIGTALTYLAGRALKAFERHTKIDIPAREERLIDGFVADGVHLAEEEAHRLDKMVMAGRAQPPMSSESKNDMAVDHAHRRAMGAGLDSWTRTRVKDKVAAQVNRARGPKNGIARPSTIPPG